MNATNNKDCARCGESKPVADFPKDRRRPDGRFPWCRPCKASDQRERNRRNDPGLEQRLADKEAQRAARAAAVEAAFCECGCGGKAGAYAEASRGPRRFIPGHEARGRVMSVESRAKITGRPISSDDPSSIHQWLVKHHPKAGRCEECGTEGPTDYAFQRHPEPHTRNREDYRELCRSCHFRADEAISPKTRQMIASNTTAQLRERGRKGALARWGERAGD